MEMRASQVIKGALGGGAKKGGKKCKIEGETDRGKMRRKVKKPPPPNVAVWDVTLFTDKSHVVHICSTWSQRSLLVLIYFLIVPRISNQTPPFLI